MDTLIYDPNNVLKSPSHLTLENMSKLQKSNDLNFVTEPQKNPWIHLDLELERFIDSVTITMKPQNLTDLYIFIGYEYPNVPKDDISPLNINKFCGHVYIDGTIENDMDWNDYEIYCDKTIRGNKMTIQFVSFNPIELNID